MIMDSKRQVNLTYPATAPILALMERERLDVLLHNTGLAESREQARRLIMAGQVSVNGEVADKPGTRVPLSAKIDIETRPAYVSRGGLKLEAALTAFAVDVQGLVAADIGASTGGFTDCLLQHGATRVYAIDVGYGQLAWELRQDPRVVVMERVNARYLQQLPELVDLITIDVSFISLKLVLPAVIPLLEPLGHVVALVKPQFEAGRKQVGKGGVVRDPAVHRAVLQDLLAWAPTHDLQTQGLIASPLRGPAGNIEFLVHWVLGSSPPKTSLEELIQTCLSGCPVGADRL
jgi:23S rRNA (cytidine1920-2'-O)/16S rRNA (cytidine1409-2'-O)-methyltransferase